MSTHLREEIPSFPLAHLRTKTEPYGADMKNSHFHAPKLTELLRMVYRMGIITDTYMNLSRFADMNPDMNHMEQK